MANTLPGTPYVESSDLVANYPAVSESLAERIDEVGVLPFADSTARGTALPTPTEGQYSYLQDTNSTEFWDGSAWITAASGKILQIVRATDATSRSTSSATFVDANISVTITPQKNTSVILLWWIVSASAERASSGVLEARLAITDSSNAAISGAAESIYSVSSQTQLIFPCSVVAYASPATSSAVTYKGRFRKVSGDTANLRNDVNIGQLYAIEVAA